MTGRPMRGIVVIDNSVLHDQALDRRIAQARGYVAACRHVAQSPRAATRSSHHPG